MSWDQNTSITLSHYLTAWLHAQRENTRWDATLSNLHCGIKIRMVAGFAEVIESEETFGCGGPIRTEFTITLDMVS